MSPSNLTTCSLTAIVLAVGVALTPGCKRAPKTPPAALPAWTVTCPTGTPIMQVKDSQTLEFTCPDGSKPTKTQVAAKK